MPQEVDGAQPAEDPEGVPAALRLLPQDLHSAWGHAGEGSVVVGRSLLVLWRAVEEVWLPVETAGKGGMVN